MPGYISITNADEAIAAGAMNRSGYVFNTLSTFEQRISYLTSVYPSMSGVAAGILLGRMEDAWQAGQQLQDTGTLPPQSQIPLNPSIAGSNMNRADVLVIVPNPDDPDNPGRLRLTVDCTGDEGSDELIQCINDAIENAIRDKSGSWSGGIPTGEGQDVSKIPFQAFILSVTRS